MMMLLTTTTCTTTTTIPLSDTVAPSHDPSTEPYHHAIIAINATMMPITTIITLPIVHHLHTLDCFQHHLQMFVHSLACINTALDSINNHLIGESTIDRLIVMNANYTKNHPLTVSISHSPTILNPVVPHSTIDSIRAPPFQHCSSLPITHCKPQPSCWFMTKLLHLAQNNYCPP